MIAIQENDVCYSIANNGHNPFNTDRVERTELPVELARSALDFEIQKIPSYDVNGRRIPGHYHLIKSTDKSFIPCVSVGEQFVPIQHIDFFDYVVNEVMPNVPGLSLEMAGTIHGGGVGLVSAKFGDTFSIKGDKSGNELRLFFNNPSNGRGRAVVGFTTVRVVCQNTLLAATKEARSDGFKVSHTKTGPAIVMGAVASIREQAVAALEMKRRCERLANISANTAMLNDALDVVYSLKGISEEHPGFKRLQKLREKVIEEFECGATAQSMTEDTAWKLLNAFTYPVFNPEKVSKRTDKAEIAYQGMGGLVAEKVNDMLLAVERVAL